MKLIKSASKRKCSFGFMASCTSDDDVGKGVATFFYNGDRECYRAVHLVGNHKTENARPEPRKGITFKGHT